MSEACNVVLDRVLGPDLHWIEVKVGEALVPRYRCSSCKEQAVANRIMIALVDEDSRFYSGTMTCIECIEIMEEFYGKPCWVKYLWQDMERQVFPVFNSACLERLKTPRAKAKLQERWKKWKGL